MCLCMHVRVPLQVRAGVHAGVRACEEYTWMYDYFIIFLYTVCGAVCAWVAGVRTCMYVCEHSNLYGYVCAGACAYP